jgi:hypothetical protein
MEAAGFYETLITTGVPINPNPTRKGTSYSDRRF